jgi:hypothetical protein
LFATQDVTSPCFLQRPSEHEQTVFNNETARLLAYPVNSLCFMLGMIANQNRTQTYMNETEWWDEIPGGGSDWITSHIHPSGETHMARSLFGNKFNDDTLRNLLRHENAHKLANTDDNFVANDISMTCAGGGTPTVIQSQN